MKKKKQKVNEVKPNITKVVLSAVVLVILMVIYIASMSNPRDKTEPSKKTEKNLTKNIINQNGEIYNVEMNEYHVIVEDVVKYKDTTGDKLEYADVIIELKLNGEKQTVKLDNLPNSALCATAEVQFEKSVYINDKLAFVTGGEGCYMIDILEVFTIQDKYIGVVYQTEAGKILNIYDKNGTDLYNRTVLTLDTKELKYTAFEEVDPKFTINKYELRFEDEEIIDYMYEIGKESYCNKALEYGYCE